MAQWPQPPSHQQDNHDPGNNTAHLQNFPKAIKYRMEIPFAIPEGRKPMKNKHLGTGIEGYRPLRKIQVAVRGVYYAVILDFSVAYKVVISALLLVGFFYYRQWLDFSLVLVATSLVIISEIFNTTIETLCDFVEGKQNPKIGLIKDMAAGAVGVSIFVWMIVIAIELFHAFSLIAKTVS